MIKKINKIRNGSALLVAMLVMGILLTLTLGLSTLVVREIRQTSDMVAAGQAFFAAEAGVENALYDLSENLPGYEPVEPVIYEDENLSYEYDINNKGDKYPYFPDDRPIFTAPDVAVPKSVLYSDFPEKTYNVLPLNESVTIPLFTANPDGTVNDIDEFLIQYYVNFDVDPDIDRIYIEKNGVQQSISLDDFDILRWKVFGNPCAAGNCSSPGAVDTLKTDAISDYYPATEGVSANRPVCIGTSNILASEGGLYNCKAPVVFEDVIKVGQNVSIEDVDLGAAGFSFARECFLSEVSDPTVGSLQGEVILKRCNIDSFINTHSRNYVTLTNIVNPDIIGIDPQVTPQYANIYYRVVTRENVDGQLVREFAEIRSDGFARGGSVKQSIDVNLRLSSFLPVFNFSLYRTDTTTDEIDSPSFQLAPGLFKLSEPFTVTPIQPSF